MKRAKEADQLYTLADLARLLKVDYARLSAMCADGQMLGPDVIIPGGGHKSRRWSASRVDRIFKEWAAPEAFAPAARADSAAPHSIDFLLATLPTHA